jgi:hypothetical protein
VFCVPITLEKIPNYQNKINMKRIFGLFLLLIITNIAFGQVESWLQDIDKTNGKDKVILLNKIAEFYTDESEGFSAKTYAKQGIELAESIDYTDGLAIGYFYLAEAYNLENDLKSAEKTYKNWYKTRKKYGSKIQLSWAIMGMAKFYQSQEKDRKTERYYKKLLKTTESGSRKEFGTLRVLAKYYQHGASYRTDRELNLKKGTKYFELLTISGQKVFGDDYKTHDLDSYFNTELQKVLAKKETKTANKIAKQWLESKAEFGDNLEIYRSARLIVRHFYDNQVFDNLPFYLNKSIEYAENMEDERYLEDAYYNAIYVSRNAKKYEAAIQYCFDLSPNIKYPQYATSALNTCVAEILKENNADLNQKISALINNWQQTLNTEKDKAAYDCAADNLLLLK